MIARDYMTPAIGGGERPSLDAEYLELKGTHGVRLQLRQLEDGSVEVSSSGRGSNQMHITLNVSNNFILRVGE